VVFRSLKHIYAQIIDDTKGRTLVSASSLDKEFREKCHSGGNIKAASLLGQILSQKVKSLGITKVVFDRDGYLYHGRIKAFAEIARKGGLVF
jgi:large subunit ribosomal protein L18